LRGTARAIEMSGSDQSVLSLVVTTKCFRGKSLAVVDGKPFKAEFQGPVKAEPKTPDGSSDG
jgi:hypothetical protein